MIHKLSDQVYWGNWQSPAELPQAKAIINVAHSFSVRRGRNIYWANLERVNWQTLYFRLAKKDAQAVDDTYMQSLSAIVEIVYRADAFPLLCHCQMGGHRGPTAAMFAAWQLGGMTEGALRRAFDGICVVRDGFGTGRNKDYHESVFSWCLSHST